MKYLTMFVVCLVALGLGGLVVQDTRILSAAETATVTGAQYTCYNASRCKEGAVTCDTWQGIKGGPTVVPCPQPHVCSYCDPDDELRSCFGGFPGEECELNDSGTEDCGQFKLGTCSNGECQNGTAIQSCVDADWRCDADCNQSDDDWD